MDTNTAIAALNAHGVHRLWVGARGELVSTAGSISVNCMFDPAKVAASWKAIDWRVSLPAEGRR